MEPLTKQELLILLENEDKRQDTQRSLIWVLVICMSISPFFAMAVSMFGFSVEPFIQMSTMYLSTISAIVIAWFTKEGYRQSKMIDMGKNDKK